MHCPQILLALAATSTAIDTYLHFGRDCQGNSAVCTNQNPNNCCRGSSGDIFYSIGFRGIPTNWNLECRGHSGGDCTNIREIQPASNTNFVCLNSGPFSGAGYGFRGKKRAAAAADVCTAEQGSCSGVQLADLLVLADGAKFDLASMEDASRDRM